MSDLPGGVTAGNVHLRWLLVCFPAFVLPGCGTDVLGPEDGPSAVRVRAGFDFTCAIDIDASVICWGRNALGQLGTGGSDSNQIAPVKIALDERFISLSTKANGNHACALTWQRDAYCWGENDFGQLGNGSTADRRTPTPVDSDLAFRSIAAGWRFTCALTVDHDAYCWGRGEWGQLGDGQAVQSPTPVAVAGGHKFDLLEVGSNNVVCGLTREGRVLCWGLAFFGSLGATPPDTCTRADGLQLACARLPHPIDSDQSFIHVTVGNSFACAIDDRASSWCWGLNTTGQLGSVPAVLCPSFNGVDQLPCSPQPVRVMGNLDFVSISAGVQHTCGVTRLGAGYCWGSNSIGQFGNGSLGMATSEPTLIVGGLEFLTVSAGANHTCGETLGRNLWCWGSNDAGQLGTANNNLELIPALVAVRR